MFVFASFFSFCAQSRRLLVVLVGACLSVSREALSPRSTAPQSFSRRLVLRFRGSEEWLNGCRSPTSLDECRVADTELPAAPVRRNLGKTSVHLWKWLGCARVCDSGATRQGIGVASVERPSNQGLRRAFAPSASRAVVSVPPSLSISRGSLWPGRGSLCPTGGCPSAADRSRAAAST